MDRSPVERAVWVLGGLAWLVTGLLGLSAANDSTGFYVTEAAWIVVHVLVFVGILGLLQSRWTADRWWGRVGLQVALAARALFIAFEVVAIVRGTDELAVFPLAVICTGLGMLVGGAAIVRGGHWRGWGRFAVLAVGAYPFLAIVPVFAATGSRPPDAIVAGWGVPIVLVGVALARAMTPSAVTASPPVVAASL